MEYIDLATEYVNSTIAWAGSLTLDDVINIVKGNLVATLLVIAIVVRLLSPNIPMREVEGSKVRSVDSIEAWNEVLDEAKKSNKIIVADFYATWCPPCKAASPIFGEWSKEYDEDLIIFIKVDVDKAPLVAQKNMVSSMPSFKIIKNGLKIDEQIGWRQDTLKRLIDKHLPEKKEVKTGERKSK